jgi:hypothetical protein
MSTRAGPAQRLSDLGRRLEPPFIKAPKKFMEFFLWTKVIFFFLKKKNKLRPKNNFYKNSRSLIMVNLNLLSHKNENLRSFTHNYYLAYNFLTLLKIKNLHANSPKPSWLLPLQKFKTRNLQELSSCKSGFIVLFL